MRWFVLVASLAAAGCGLDREGLGIWDLGDGGRVGTDGSVGLTDSASGGGFDSVGVPLLDGPPGSCVASIPAGWSLVAYETSRVACPAGYTSSYDALADPQAAPGACACSCTVTSPPTCDDGTLHIHWGMSSTCPSSILPLGVGGGGCTQMQPGGPAANALAVPPVGLSGGNCTGSAAGDTTQVTSSQVRYCVVPAPDAEGVCGGGAPTGFSGCLRSPGDVPCPTGTPFQSRTVLADTETLVCSACTSCGFQGICTGATAKFYGDYLCQGYVGSLTADGTCTQPAWAGQQVHGVIYQAQAMATCAATGTSATFAAIEPQTVCCR
jgi:hypothetical protein